MENDETGKTEAEETLTGVPAELSALYKRVTGVLPDFAAAIPQAGGDRRYWRLSAAGRSPLIGCHGTDKRENGAFLALDRIFRKHGCAVPEVVDSTPDTHYYLQQDLGEKSLFSLFSDADESELRGLLRSTLSSLVQLQSVPQSEWEDCVMAAPFGERLVKWDLNYFKYEYLRPSSILFDEELLEDDFDRLCTDLLAIDRRGWGFMYRDCQSRNIMLAGPNGKTPYFIDFQGGRLGPCLYDVVSLLYQARAPFSDSLRREMLDEYAGLFGREMGMSPDDVLAPLGILRLFRTLQVLGAYGLRGLVERRAHFVRSIPGALRNLSFLVEEGVLRPYPELQRVAERLVADPRFETDGSQGLTVTVFSFSYMRGYPSDYSGNGGGFMFDCRAMHNPGRYEQYRILTGDDRPVIDFLEGRGEVQKFLEHAWGVTDAAVARYLDRGFSSLQIGFGCTGGQHRSVYCARQTARHIKVLYPAAKVHLIHREQRIDEWIK